MGTIKDKIEQQKREEYAYKKMLDYGWKPHQASAIVGNLKRESNFNTTTIGTADDKGSQGVAQWHSGRLDNLKKQYGSNWTDFDNQLDFVNWELNNSHKKAGDALRQTKGVWDAGRVVTDKYEAPKVKWDRDEKRQSYVTDNYRKYSGVQLTDEDKANFLKGTAQRAIDSQITPNLIDFEVPQENTNLASIPEVQEEPKEVVSAKEELQQKQNEENFIADFFANAQQEEVMPQQQVAQIVQTNALEKYAQIESFVDAQQGGTIKRPTYVESKNDPRYIAYQDSLNLYNTGEQAKKQLKGLREYPYDKSDDLRVTDSKAYEAFKRTGILPTTENAGSYRKEGADFTYGYKKPTQPVLFTPQHRALQHPIQKLNPTGLQEFQQELPSADYTIQQVTQQPKYYDVVDKVNQNFGGVESSYKWYPENGIPLQPLSQEKYQDGTPYNTRAMIPYYQEGGKIFNPNLSNQKDFQEWYKLNTIEGKNNIPYSEQLDYDYLSFFKNKDYLTYKGGHFPDKYKRPNHETFSNESLYSTPENPGGYWQGEQYNKNGKFTYQSGGNIPISAQGVYDYPMEEVVVPTKDGRITMKNINYPILGTDEFGNRQLMQPNQEYQFQGKTIHEIPQLTTQEKSFLKEMQKYKR